MTITIFTFGVILMFVGDQFTSYITFWLGLFLALLALLIFLAPVIFPEKKTDWNWIAYDKTHTTKNADNEFIPLEFANIVNIDEHTRQISYMGKSFLIWKNESGQPYYQEVNINTNLPIGKKVTADEAKILVKDIKRKIKEV